MLRDPAPQKPPSTADFAPHTEITPCPTEIIFSQNSQPHSNSPLPREITPCSLAPL